MQKYVVFTVLIREYPYYMECFDIIIKLNKYCVAKVSIVFGMVLQVETKINTPHGILWNNYRAIIWNIWLFLLDSSEEF